MIVELLLHEFCVVKSHSLLYLIGTNYLDFWTTKCTNCPAALDELNILANDERYQQIKFASICCDSCDGARNIIDQNDTPRWDKMSHYFMEHEYKELAKSMLGFKQVPFYVVVNVKGEIVQMGSKKHIDFDNLPGMVPDVFEVIVDEKKEGRLGMASPTSVTDQVFQTFQIDDLDF